MVFCRSPRRRCCSERRTKKDWTFYNLSHVKGKYAGHERGHRMKRPWNWGTISQEARYLNTSCVHFAASNMPIISWKINLLYQNFGSFRIIFVLPQFQHENTDLSQPVITINIRRRWGSDSTTPPPRDNLLWKAFYTGGEWGVGRGNGHSTAAIESAWLEKLAYSVISRFKEWFKFHKPNWVHHLETARK